MPSTVSEIGARLRAIRNRLGWSQGKAAEEVERLALERGLDPESRHIPTSHAAINRWENGVSTPNETGLGLLAEAYGVRLADIRMNQEERDFRQDIEDRLKGLEAQDAEEVIRFIDFVKQRRAG